MISVRSEVQILPGPPRLLRSKMSGRGSGCASNCESDTRAEKGSGAPAAAPAVARATADAATDFELRSKPWGCSSVGRAPALQAGGRRFDPDHLHHRGNAVASSAAAVAQQPREHPTERCGAAFMSKRGSGCASNRESGRARQAMDGWTIDRSGKAVCPWVRARGCLIFDR